MQAVFSTPHPPHVVILLATYNGADHLEEQLQSFAKQDYGNWSLIASDDGSTDQTRRILSDFADAGHAVTVLNGPGKGAAANFLFLAAQLPEYAPDGAWLAFSDQDDVWLPDKLSRGIAKLIRSEAENPALFCSRTWVTGDDLKGRRLSAFRPRTLSFRNALVQNVAAGNTILLNAAATRTLTEAASATPEIVIHDWWTYQVISGVGGYLCHDDEPTLLYRQHAVNEIGANDNARARLKRMAMLLNGRFAAWNRINLKAMRATAHLFTPENQLLLADFERLSSLSRFAALRLLWKMRLYRQTVTSTGALWFATLLRRL